MLKIRFHFDGKCRFHPRYNPKEHGKPGDSHCAGCESLYVIHLYLGIAEKKAKEGEGIEVRQKAPAQPEPNPEDLHESPDDGVATTPPGQELLSMDTDQ